jgi:hypothetical protein
MYGFLPGGGRIDVEEEAQTRRDRRQVTAGRCVGLAGQGGAEAVRAIAVTEVTYYRWRQEYGGLKGDQVKRLKDLVAENARLRRAVSDPERGCFGKCMVRSVFARLLCLTTSTVCVNVSGLSRVGCGCSQVMMRSARFVPRYYLRARGPVSRKGLRSADQLSRHHYSNLANSAALFL